MIMTRTPLRISFCGGGSDIPAYYEAHSGCVISTSIDKYVYLAVQNSFYPEYVLKYSKAERSGRIEDIGHPILRECLKEYADHPVEVTSMADVPAGTGLGSSSSFTVGLVHSLRLMSERQVSKEVLADAACDIEINRLGEPIGKQDQYAAAYGGLNYYRFNRNGSVDVEPIRISSPEKEKLESNLLLMFTGKTRSASEILEKQRANFLAEKTENQSKLCLLTERLRHEMENNNVDFMGKALDEGWKLKKGLVKGVSSDEIDSLYEKAIDRGALGGKILGAGGGGFLLFYADRSVHGDIIRSLPGLKHMPIRFDRTGSVQIYKDTSPLVH
jgi:D-glycero-alpha-D-manno-heptose-7-phosphate kinase